MTSFPDPPLAETELGPELDAAEAAAPSTNGGAAASAALILRRYVLPRIITLWLISVIAFACTFGLGVDPALRALGREATPEQLAAFRKASGLDRPAYVQYWAWLAGFVRGDWGVSPVNDRPVTEQVVPRMVNTLILALASIVLALPASIAFGIYLARPLRRPLELALTVGNVALAGVPIYVIGIVFIYVFSVKLNLTPVDSTGLEFGSVWQKMATFVLPTLGLALSEVPHISRLTQVSVRETMSSPYARAAVLRGLPRRTITWRHLMPNAAGPIVNVVALDLIWLVAGVIVVENVFGFPGLGTLLIESIGTGDVIMVQTIAVLTGAMFICISLAADLLVTVFNPRLRSG